MTLSLHRGAVDLLGICDGLSPSLQLLRSFLFTHGDTVVHFSCEAAESGLSNVVQRLIVLTNNSVFVIPKSAMETGIFFDCRIALETVAQVIVSDAETEAAEASLLQRSTITNDAMVIKTLVFPNVSVRKTFLLSLCITRPSLPILQRRTLDSVPRNSRDAAAGRFQTSQSANHDASFQSPVAKTSRHVDITDVSPLPKTPPANASTFAEPIFDIADDVFSVSRERLREILSDTWNDDTYDAERAASRPREEDPTRAAEREKIKADLDHRERKIIQNIEFRLKYPTKPATRVQPGVEFDKAHEERLTLPDDISEDELLGPALFSLWQEWKRCGGLMGGDGDPKHGGEPEWTVYNSNELISALREKEDELFGFVGPRSLKKVRSMRELAARERMMFLNSNVTVVSPPRASALPLTKPKPFHLSESPFSSLKAHAKLLEKTKIVAQMKAKYDETVKARHELQKQHYHRQLQQLSVSPER